MHDPGDVCWMAVMVLHTQRAGDEGGCGGSGCRSGSGGGDGLVDVLSTCCRG